MKEQSYGLTLAIIMIACLSAMAIVGLVAAGDGVLFGGGDGRLYEPSFADGSPEQEASSLPGASPARDLAQPPLPLPPGLPEGRVQP
jgi:hypothetical protein